MSRGAAAAVPSPCVSLCTMDQATGWCRGCLRTLDEIAVWGGLDDGNKRIVLRRLGQRRVAWRAAQQAASAQPLPDAAGGEPGP